MKIRGRNSSKRSQSNIIVIVLIILLIIVLLVILWNIIMALVKQKSNTIAITQKIAGVNININHGPLDWQNSGGNNINITISRGGDPVELIEQRTINTTLNSPADIVSITDMSGSMYNSENSSCVGISDPSFCSLNTAACCCQEDPTSLTNPKRRLDCENNADDCKKCHNGTLGFDPVSGSTKCVFNNIIPFGCWDWTNNKLGNYNFDATACNNCGGTFMYRCEFTKPVPPSNSRSVLVYDQQWVQPSEDLCNISGGDIYQYIQTEATFSNYQYHCFITSSSSNICRFNDPATSCGNPVICPGTRWYNIGGISHCEIGSYNATECYGIDCNNPAICSGVGGHPEQANWCRYRVVNVGRGGTVGCSGSGYYAMGMGVEENVCGKDYCNGSLYTKKRIDFAKNATETFVNKIFDLSQVHKMSLINVTTSLNAVPTTGLYDYNNKQLLINRIHEWNITLASASNSKTNLCLALRHARDTIKNLPDYKAIVLMTDGDSNVDCNNNPGVTLQDRSRIAQELIDEARDINKNPLYHNIHVYTIGIGKEANVTILQAMADPANGNGTFVNSSNLADLTDLYDQIAYKIQQDTLFFYGDAKKWDFIRSIVTNGTDTCIRPIYDIIRPGESKKITIPTCGLVNLQRIELYLVSTADDGTEVTKLLDTWENQ